MAGLLKKSMNAVLPVGIIIKFVLPCCSVGFKIAFRSALFEDAAQYDVLENISDIAVVFVKHGISIFYSIDVRRHRHLSVID